MGSDRLTDGFFFHTGSRTYILVSVRTSNGPSGRRKEASVRRGVRVWSVSLV